jgi:hypothetical protein
MIQTAVKFIDYLDDLPSPSTGPLMVAAQVGIGNELGTDVFQVVICNAEWIAQQETASAYWPRGCLIVRSFDHDHVRHILEALVTNFAGSTDDQTLAQRLNGYLLWEFEDFDDFQGEPTIPKSSGS